MQGQDHLRDYSNLRDIGGVATRDGRLVRRGMVFRSGALSALSARDFAALERLGIRLVCDLRSASERAREPSPWPAHRAPETLAMEVSSDLRSGRGDILQALDDDPSAQGALKLMRGLYEELPHALLPHLETLFVRIAQGSATPLIVHCAAGKDRTGVLCAFLLLALGVPRDAVVRDYACTAAATDTETFQRHVAGVISQAIGRMPTLDVVKVMSAADAAYLDATFDATARSYGSIDAYLRRAGLDDETTHALHGRLLTT